VELSRQDYSDLIEAVEAWENKDDASQMIGEMMEALVARGDKAHAAMIRQEVESRRREQALSKRIRKERSIMLRAKLIQMRDQANGSVVNFERCEAFKAGPSEDA
jgi:hypothetical protein